MHHPHIKPGVLCLYLILVLLLAACARPLAVAPSATAPAIQMPSNTPNDLQATLPATLPASGATPSATTTNMPTATATPVATTLPTETITIPETLAPPTATATPLPALPADDAPLIALDPGHGGRDLGARHFGADGQMDFNESEINLDLALRLRELLLAQGYRVLMTRDADYGLNPEYLDLNGDEIIDHVDELQIRLDMVNEAGADLLVSIHQNAFYYSADQPAEDVGGVVTFYCQDRAFGEQNLVLGQAIHGELLAAFVELGHDVLDRGVLDDLVLMTPDEPGTHLIVLGPESDRIVRPSQMPGILSETLFITHNEEAALIQRPEARQRLAQAYAEGIILYLTETESADTSN